MSYLLRYN